MSTFTTMKTTLREEATIPMRAVDAFKDAFEQAACSSQVVTFVKEKKLVELNEGQQHILADLSHAYVVPNLKRSVLKRKNKQGAMA